MFITCNLAGGLGNQMFKIATVLAIAADTELKPVFEKVGCSRSYGGSRPVYWDSLFYQLNSLEEKVNFQALNDSGRNTPIKPGPNKNYKLVHGYFQSYLYFHHQRDVILNMFRLPVAMEDVLKFEYEKHTGGCKTVSVHVRRGDYLRLTNIYVNLANTDYYKDAIEQFDKDVMLVVFCVDIEWAKKYFAEIAPDRQYWFVQKKDYEELVLMSMCTNNIIANSTFSWWGAYLNQNNNKVICPGDWFNPKSRMKIKDMYLDEWVVI